MYHVMWRGKGGGQAIIYGMCVALRDGGGREEEGEGEGQENNMKAQHGLPQTMCKYLL